MASYYMKISPATSIREIHRKLEAFKALYGGDVIVAAKGFSIETTRKRDGIVFPITGVDVTNVGNRYITIKLPNSEGGEFLRVDMKNTNHGITELMFLTRA